MADQASGILSPFLRRKRIAVALPFIKGRVLDVGCGIGTLAGHIQAEKYVGIDIDVDSIDIAKKEHSCHKFYTIEEYKALEDKFDTIVALAVIEHVDNAVDFIIYLKSLLVKDGLILITTPHPNSELIHGLGSKIGIFSGHANEEHQELIGKRKMAEIANKAGIKITTQQSFLFGLNQLFVLS